MQTNAGFNRRHHSVAAVITVTQGTDSQKCFKNLSWDVIALQVNVFETEGVVVHLYRIVTLMEIASKLPDIVTEEIASPLKIAQFMYNLKPIRQKM